MPNELESSSWPTTPSLYNAYWDKNSVVLYLGSHVVVVAFCGLCLFITVLPASNIFVTVSIARCRWACGMAAVAVRGRRESHSDLVAEPPKLRSIASPSDRQLHDACFSAQVSSGSHWDDQEFVITEWGWSPAWDP